MIISVILGPGGRPPAKQTILDFERTYIVYISCYCFFFYASKDCSYEDLRNGISATRDEMSDTIDNNAYYDDTPAGGRLSSLGQ